MYHAGKNVSVMELFRFVLEKYFFEVNPLMPGGNKKVTNT